MLAHRLRRWPNTGQTLGGCVVFAGGMIITAYTSTMTSQHNVYHTNNKSHYDTE